MKSSNSKNSVFQEAIPNHKNGRIFKFMCSVLDSVDKFSSSADSKIYT